MRPRRVAALIVSAALAWVGCGIEPRLCTTEARSGLVLRVTDAVTGEPALRGSSVRVVDGSYSERVSVDADGIPVIETSGGGRTQLPPSVFGEVFAGAYERAGTYQVTVSKPGYREWSRRVRLAAEPECGHVEGQRLDVVLERI